MKPIFHPQLVSDTFGDTALFVAFLFARRARPVSRPAGPASSARYRFTCRHAARAKRTAPGWQAREGFVETRPESVGPSNTLAAV